MLQGPPANRKPHADHLDRNHWDSWHHDERAVEKSTQTKYLTRMLILYLAQKLSITMDIIRSFFKPCSSLLSPNTKYAIITKHNALPNKITDILVPRRDLHSNGDILYQLFFFYLQLQFINIYFVYGMHYSTTQVFIA